MGEANGCRLLRQTMDADHSTRHANKRNQIQQVTGPRPPIPVQRAIVTGLRVWSSEHRKC